MIRIDRVAVVTPPGEKPPYSLNGYCVTPDGTTYTLLRKWWHGAMLALLYPEKAKEAGYVIPDAPDDVDVYEFQRFELDNHDLLPVIRICPGRVIGPLSLDRGCDPSTPEQVAAVRLIFKELGKTGNNVVSTDHKDMTVREMFEKLTSDENVWGGGPRVVRKHRLVKKGENAYEIRSQAALETEQPLVAARAPEADGWDTVSATS